jgi:hypothetical protein
MCCCVGKGGELTRSGSTGYTAKWACNCGTRHRNAGSKQSCARLAIGHAAERDLGDGLCPDQLATGRKLRVLTIMTRSRASRRRSNLGSTSAALMLWKYLKRSAGKSDSRKPSGSIKAQSSCHAISTSKLISAASRSTSHDLASRLTMPSSSRSMANSERNV